MTMANKTNNNSKKSKLSKSMNYAIVLASGSGKRLKSKNDPKHLMQIKGVPSIVWTIRALDQSDIFNKIIIVTKQREKSITSKIVSEYYLNNDSKFIYTIGAKSRMQTFFNGLDALSKHIKIKKNDIFSLVDANRPLCPSNQISKLLELAKLHNCSCLARPVINGVARINSNKKITNVPNKNDFVEFVTPEFIKYDVLNKSIKSKNFLLRSLVEYSLSVSVKPAFDLSSELNTKLTYPEDLAFLENLVYKNKIAAPSKVPLK